MTLVGGRLRAPSVDPRRANKPGFNRLVGEPNTPHHLFTGFVSNSVQKRYSKSTKTRIALVESWIAVLVKMTPR